MIWVSEPSQLLMSDGQFVDGWPLQKTVELKRAAVRRPRVAYAANVARYHTWSPYF